MIKLFNASEIENLIESSIKGPNTSFLSKAHSLWVRFHNYDKSPPTVLVKEGNPVCCIFATHNLNKYSNLYEIVTLQGLESKGYATEIWSEWIGFAVEEKNSQRLKLSCTPESIGWHMRNELIFWAVDPSGSLRSDQRLFPTIEEQRNYRLWAECNSEEAAKELPVSVRRRFINEQLGMVKLSKPKRIKAEKTIEVVGQRWLGGSL